MNSLLVNGRNAQLLVGELLNVGIGLVAEDVLRLREDAVEDPPDGEGGDGDPGIVLVLGGGQETAVGPAAARLH